MVKVVFTSNLRRHVALADAEASGRTVREVLDNVLAHNPQARGYVLDDQSVLRKHMTIFVDGHMIHDRARLTPTPRRPPPRMRLKISCMRRLLESAPAESGKEAGGRLYHARRA